jgi:hypothetical protein
VGCCVYRAGGTGHALPAANACVLRGNARRDEVGWGPTQAGWGCHLQLPGQLTLEVFPVGQRLDRATPPRLQPPLIPCVAPLHMWSPS